MRILYGIQATGNGHLSRARELIRFLNQYGHDIHVVLSGRDPKLIRETKHLEPFDSFRGLTYINQNGRINLLKTAGQLKIIQFCKDILSFNAKGIDLVITDFEPISAFVAKKCNIPSIGIAHQYAFCYRIPFVNIVSISYLYLRYFMTVDYPVGLHWHHFNQPILPPIVPDNLRRAEEKKAKILVYLPWEENEDIRLLLHPITSHQFYIYSNFEKSSDVDNLHYRPFSRVDFLLDLADCSGVISNAGFSLSSEALHLGKKLLVKPQGGQIEQESNAATLSGMKLGVSTKKLSTEIVQDWLTRSSNAPMNYPNVVKPLSEWIDSRCWDDVMALSQSLWAKM